MKWLVILISSVAVSLGQLPTLPGGGVAWYTTPASGYKNPGQVADVMAWWKADSLTANNGDLIASWSDSSGNGHTATASGTARAYYTNTTLLGSKPALVVNGSTTAYTITVAAAATNYTMIAVMYTTSASGNSQYVFDSETGRLIIGYDNATSPNGFGYYDGSWHDNSATVYLTPYVITWNLLSTGATVYTNGISHYTSTYTKTAIGGGARIGSRYDGTDTYLKGMLAEFVIYTNIISTADRQSVESGLGQKYGITVTH